MKCPKCGTDNPDYFVFCQTCFEELPKVEKPHKSTARMNETPITGFAELPNMPTPPKAPRSEIAPQEQKPYAPFSQQQTIVNPDEPYLSDKKYVKTPIEREEIQVNYTAKQPDTAAMPRPRSAQIMEDVIGQAPQEQPSFSVPQQVAFQEPEFEPQPVPQRRVTTASVRPKQRMDEVEEIDYSEPRDTFDAFNEPESATTRRTRRDARMPDPAKKPNSRTPKERALSKSQQDTELYEDYYDDNDPMVKERKRSKIITILFWVALFVLIGAVIFFITTFAVEKYGSVQNAVSEVFNIDIGGTKNAITVNESTADGKPSHAFTVNGKEGQQLRFDDLDRVYPLPAKGFNVPDSYWISETPDPSAATITVAPSLTIIEEDGTETKLEVPSFTVDVPSSVLSITSPQPSAGITVDQPELVVSGSITPADGRLLVNGQDISASVAADGTFTYTYTIAQTGDFSIELTTDMLRTRAVTEVVSGKYEKSEVSIVMGEIPTTTEEVEVIISGTVEAGATIAVEGSTKESAPEADPVSGEFMFTARMPEYGSYDYKLTASSNGISSEYPFTIIRTPEVNSYTDSAKKLDYAKVLKNPNDSAGNVYRFDGVLVEAQTSDDGSVQYLFAVDGKGEQAVLVTYFGTNELAPETKYRVYATANKNTEDKSAILMNAFFIYAAEE